MPLPRKWFAPSWAQGLLWTFLMLCLCIPAWAQDRQFEESSPDLDFEIPEAEPRKPIEINGYLETAGTAYGRDKGSLLFQQKYIGQDLDDQTYAGDLRAKIEAKAQGDAALAYVRFKAQEQRDAEGWNADGVLEEGFLAFKPTPSMTVEAGKRVMKWGKGYAWNPAAFVSRPKDPDDAEETLEGYGMVDADFIKSFDGPLQTLAFTPVVIPVSEHFNKEWGKPGSYVGAAKVYALLLDTDIDVMFLAGDEAESRAGFDFSKNLTANFEVHGEAAVVFDHEKPLLDSQGNISADRYDAWSFLAGLRYLNSYDTTFILEYYRNGLGYSQTETSEYYSFVEDALAAYQAGNKLPLMKSRRYSQAYSSQNAMEDYLYLRIVQKDPFDILYFSPALTTIANLDDGSLSLSPELLYAPVTNWEFRLKSWFFLGDDDTEYGEKQNDYRVEARIRYYF
jgi:hypothetical protein